MKFYTDISTPGGHPLARLKSVRIGQLMLCGLLGFAVNAFADLSASDKADIAKIRAECPKVAPPADPDSSSGSYSDLVKSYNYLINVSLLEGSIDDDFTGFTNDAELIALLKQLKQPEYFTIAKNAVENAADSYRALFTIDRALDVEYVKKASACHLIEMYVDVGSKANMEMKEYFRLLLDKAKKQVAYNAAKKAENDAYAKTVRDDKYRLLNPKSNTATIFDVRFTANSCTTSQKVGVLNPFLEPKSLPDTKYLIIDASIKNMSSSSRGISGGSVIFSKNGKIYSFDQIDPVRENGFGDNLGALNPLITYHTKLVFRIPSDLTGKIAWMPDGATVDDGVTAACGSI
ncbi:MAG: hypothetical protein JWP80_1997 [Pseudomonas sp.]|nr:hypothetical protein [Pseudomonas sp.]